MPVASSLIQTRSLGIRALKSSSMVQISTEIWMNSSRPTAWSDGRGLTPSPSSLQRAFGICEHCHDRIDYAYSVSKNLCVSDLTR
jgi:hypothetical protein